MARRGTELRTDFTGDDSKFRKVVDRQKGSARELGASWKKAGKDGAESSSKYLKSLEKVDKKYDKLTKSAKKLSLITAGILATKKGLSNDQVAAEETDSLIKLSDRTGSDFERFQRQAIAARKANIPLNDYANTLTRIARKTEEAKDGSEGLIKAFTSLDIDIEKFSKLSPQSRIARLAEAFEQSTDKDKALKDLFKIMEDDAKKFLVLFKDGAKGIVDAEKSAVGIISEEAGRNAESVLDSQADTKNEQRARRVKHLGGLKNLDRVKKAGESIADGFDRVMSGEVFTDGFFTKVPKNERLAEIEKTIVAVDKLTDAEKRNERFLKAKKEPEAKKAPQSLFAVNDRSGTPALMGLRTSRPGGSQKTPEFRLLKEFKDLQLEANQQQAEFINLLKREL